MNATIYSRFVVLFAAAFFSLLHPMASVKSNERINVRANVSPRFADTFQPLVSSFVLLTQMAVSGLSIRSSALLPIGGEISPLIWGCVLGRGRAVLQGFPAKAGRKSPYGSMPYDN